MSSGLAIPAGPRDLSKAWIEEMLACADHHAHVESFRWRQIGTSRGIGSKVVRVEPSYVRPDPGLPASFVVKFPLDTDATTEEPIELRFYRELATRVPVNTPRCLYQATDLHAGRWILVLEDLRGLRPLGDVAGVTAKDAQIAVRALAAFHARFWSHTEHLDWVRDSRARISLYEEWIEANNDASLVSLRELLPADRVDVALSAARSLGHAVRLLDEEPRTLVHLDYRADNMLLDRFDQLWLLDFQPLSRLRGPVDLATFIGTSLRHNTRRGCAADLLDVYIGELRQHGVTAYGPIALLRDVRLGLIRWLAYTVALLPEPEVRSGRLRRILECWVDRFTYAVQEFEALVELDRATA